MQLSSEGRKPLAAIKRNHNLKHIFDRWLAALRSPSQQPQPHWEGRNQPANAFQDRPASSVC
jgi:hypothetical protein